MKTVVFQVYVTVPDTVPDRSVGNALQESMTRFGWSKPEVEQIDNPRDHRPEDWLNQTVGIE